MRLLVLTLLVIVAIATATVLPEYNRGSYGTGGYDSRDQRREYDRETSGGKVLDINISEQERNRDREYIRDRDQREGYAGGFGRREYGGYGFGGRREYRGVS